MDPAEDLNILSFQIFLGISAMVLLTVFIIVFFIVYQRRLLKEQLKAQQIESSYQKELLNAGILAQEAERERVAIDLHDSIGGLLSATKIYVQNVHLDLQESQFQLFKERALEALNENIKEIRIITNDLLPQSLERLGIVPAAKAMTQKLSELKDIEVDFFNNQEVRFEKEREKALFRILQELTNNTLKYAEAKNVSIEFNFMPNKLLFCYKDDGQGFDRVAYEKHAGKDGFGLKSMQSRAVFLEGQMTYDTAPGKGVEVNISIPLPEESI